MQTKKTILERTTTNILLTAGLLLATVACYLTLNLIQKAYITQSISGYSHYTVKQDVNWRQMTDVQSLLV